MEEDEEEEGSMQSSQCPDPDMEFIIHRYGETYEASYAMKNQTTSSVENAGFWDEWHTRWESIPAGAKLQNDVYRLVYGTNLDIMATTGSNSLMILLAKGLTSINFLDLSHTQREECERFAGGNVQNYYIHLVQATMYHKLAETETANKENGTKRCDEALTAHYLKCNFIFPYTT